VTGRYDLTSRQLLLLPVFEGVAATSVNTTLGDTRLYAGELFHCDDPAVLLSAVQDDADKLLLEIHNPTAQARTVKLTAVAGFAPLTGLDLTVPVAPFSSEKRELTVAAGTLDYGVYRGE
jgi:hypothetical protein